ncbi:MAG: CcmD family protein [Caldilineaceae bacterium]|nr:CcmD family protein [Caldilineaceae bacterium]MCB0091537.1 CcmD family protein [Caldilineaceae bacterium]MCB0097935.1 CcmD family protein [Caldilineaceae bacterium]MCB0138709.1 CcmD family protein [Caldilineaceae bacterium]MCB9148134.1 CcmD family protein [Caldilineaceae bacterium]
MGYLVAAFITVWLLVTIYALFVSLRQRKLEQDVQMLEELVQEKLARGE